MQTFTAWSLLDVAMLGAIAVGLVAAIYVAIALPIDLATGWNYGFVGPSRPDVPTIVDLLGPWPRRLLLIAGIAAAAMAVAMLPFGRRERATRTPAPSQRARRA